MLPSNAATKMMVMVAVCKKRPTYRGVGNISTAVPLLVVLTSNTSSYSTPISYDGFEVLGRIMILQFVIPQKKQILQPLNDSPFFRHPIMLTVQLI